MNLSRKSLIGTFALVASLSAPLAFAQTDTSATDASTQSTTATDSTQSTPPADQQTTTSNDAATTSNDAAAAAGDPAKKSWADVDMDKDGNLSKAEAAAVPALGQVFDKADANADGSLTADEYKAYVKAEGKGDK